MINKALLRNFWTKHADFNIEPVGIAFYFYLLHLRSLNKGKEFSVSDSEVSRVLSIQRSKVRMLRSTLQDLGLVQISVINGIAPKYIILGIDIGTDNKKPAPEKRKSIAEKMILNAPTREEFLEYAKTLAGYDNGLEAELNKRYSEWERNGWKNKQGRVITDYKATLKAMLPFLRQEIVAVDIPKIKRPK